MPRPGWRNTARGTGHILIVLALCLMLAMLPLAGCRAAPVVGEIDQSATMALVRFEALEAGLSGVVYRTINNFNAFLGASEVPALVVFYDRSDPLNALVIPKLEQLADDYRDRLQIVWIDARAHEQVAASFSVERTPHFTMVVGAVLKRSLIGFDDQGSVRLDELIKPYVP